MPKSVATRQSGSQHWKHHTGVSINAGSQKYGENRIKMDDLGVPPDMETLT